MIKYIGLFIQPNQDKYSYSWITDLLDKQHNFKIILFDSNISKNELNIILDIISILIVPGGLPGYEYIEKMYQHNHFLSHAIDKYKIYNKKGIYKIIWGICFGLHQFSYVESNLTRDEIIDVTDSVNYLTSINQINQSKLFNINYDKKSQKYNNHQYSVLPDKFYKSRLSDEYIITHISVDRNNVQFIASYEHKIYPFFMFQWHSEHNEEYFYHSLLFNEINKTNNYTKEIPESIRLKII